MTSPGDRRPDASGGVGARAVAFQHPLAYLLGLEGLALMRAWGGDHDERFVRARIAEARRLLDDETLAGHPGVTVEVGATDEAYREWAPSYDDPGNELLVMDLPAFDAVLDRLRPGVAVDAGCGTGRLAGHLDRRGHRVVGVDRSPAMLAEARHRVPRAHFVTGDLERLPLRTGSADLVVSGLALTHVLDPGPVLAELARVLRPGGTAVLSDVHPELVYLGSVVKGGRPVGRPRTAASHRHSVADQLRAALAAGFAVRGLTELPGPPDVTGAPGPPEPNEQHARPVREVGSWWEWPWTLMTWDPEATRAAWDTPAMLVWHLELADAGR